MVSTDCFYSSFLLSVVDGPAFPPGFLVGVAFLHPLLDLVASIATSNGTADRGQLLAVTAADLITKSAADHCTHHRSRNLVGILGLPRERDDFITAFLATNVRRLAVHCAVSGHCGNCRDRQGTHDAANKKLLVHSEIT